MKDFEEYLASIENPQHFARMIEVLEWVTNKFPNLTSKIAWNQPMFTNHGTFIIGFSVSKNYMSIAPEEAGIEQFSDDIVHAGYDHTKGLFRIPWKSPVDFTLLERIIEFNIIDKADCTTFWRK